MKVIWVRTALLFLFIAASIGALLRWAFVAEVKGMEFRHYLHAHSHLAMLGWVFLMLYAFLIHSFLTENQQSKKIYKTLFGLIVIMLAAVMYVLTGTMAPPVSPGAVAGALCDPGSVAGEGVSADAGSP